MEVIKAFLVLVFGLCQAEDSANCVWDARVQGNGEGISFLYLQTEEVELLYLLGN
jgi:hypothetical protein